MARNCCFNSPLACSRESSFNTLKKAAKVLPVPVGEIINTFLPAAMDGQALFCGGVGDEKRFLNQSKTGDSGKGIRMQKYYHTGALPFAEKSVSALPQRRERG